MIKIYVIARDKAQFLVWAKAVRADLQRCKLIETEADSEGVSQITRQLVVLKGYNDSYRSDELRQAHAVAILRYCQSRGIHGVAEVVYE
jgi:hypothetical protein